MAEGLGFRSFFFSFVRQPVYNRTSADISPFDIARFDQLGQPVPDALASVVHTICKLWGGYDRVWRQGHFLQNFRIRHSFISPGLTHELAFCTLLQNTSGLIIYTMWDLDTTWKTTKYDGCNTDKVDSTRRAKLTDPRPRCRLRRARLRRAPPRGVASVNPRMQEKRTTQTDFGGSSTNHGLHEDRPTIAADALADPHTNRVCGGGRLGVVKPPHGATNSGPSRVGHDHTETCYCTIVADSDAVATGGAR